MAASTAIRPVVGRVWASSSPQSSIASCSPASTVLSALSTAPASRCSFSTTAERSERRPRRDGNRLRGVSSMYRSGPRYPLSVGEDDMPKPVDYKREVKVDPNHGLYQFFFNKKKSLITPDEMGEHGRSWTVEELRHKSWEDLHKLWWVCLKEKNRIETAKDEFMAMDLRKGLDEIKFRGLEVKRTMKSIRHVLTERFYLWEDSRTAAASDPEIDLNSTSNPYTPADYMEAADSVLEPIPEPDSEPVPSKSEYADATGPAAPVPSSLSSSTPPPAEPSKPAPEATKP